MTQNQLQYWRDQETARANREQEKISNRAQRWKEFVDLRQLNETRRTHIANEGINERSQVANSQHLERMDSETARHNLRNEYLTAQSNDLAQQNLILGYHNADIARENSIRSAVASKYSADSSAAVGFANVSEASRANQAREAENYRSNLANEAISGTHQSILALDADTRRQNLNFEQSKWSDSVVTAQRKANLQQTQAKTADIAQNAMDRRVSTITNSMKNIGSIFSPLGGYSYK